MPYNTEQILWAAVLDRAIEDLTYAGKDAEYYKNRAKAWFREGPRVFKSQQCDILGCDPQIGSFLWVCTILGLNPNCVRRQYELHAH